MDLAALDSLCFYWKQVAIKSDTMYIMGVQKFEELMRVNDSLHSSLKKEKRKNRKIGIGVGVGGTFLGMILGVLLGK